MLRRNQLITTAALVAACAAPGSAVAQDDLRMPDTKDAAREAAIVQPPQDLRSPDAKDAARDAFREAQPQDLRSPDAKDAGRPAPAPQGSPVVEIRQVPSSGFDWSDAGIGAAGMLALFSIAVGSALLVTSRRRRRGYRVATQ